MFDSFDIILQLTQTGAVGVMLGLAWRFMIKKDRQEREMIKAMNRERQRLYETHSEMVVEVTAALVNKNNTDEQMTIALVKMTEEYRLLRDIIKERKNETS